MIGATLLALLVNAGQLKATPLLSWAPVDLTILLGALVGAWAILALLTQPSRLAPAWPLFLLLVVLSLSSIEPTYGDYASTKIVTLFSVTAVLMLSPFLLLQHREQVDAFFSTTLGIAFFAAIFTITNPATVADYSTRVTFDGTNTIGAARILGAGIVVCVVRAIWSDSTARTRIAYVALVPVLLWALLSTGSRGPFVAAALAVLVVCIVAVVTRRSNVWMLVALVAITAAGSVAADRASVDGSSRILGFFEGARDGSTRARNELWIGTTELIPSQPFGVGMGGFSETGVSWGAYAYPHNIVLEVFAEAGWLTGLLLCAIMLTALGRCLAQAKTSGQFLTLGLLVFSTINAMVSGDINSNRLLWVIMSIALMQPRLSAAIPSAARDIK